jgi:hypothetical protein
MPPVPVALASVPVPVLAFPPWPLVVPLVPVSSPQPVHAVTARIAPTASDLRLEPRRVEVLVVIASPINKAL